MKIPPSLALATTPLELEEEVDEEEVLDEEEVEEEVLEEVDWVQLAAIGSPGSLVEAPVGYEAMVAIPQLLSLFLDIMMNP